MQRVKIYGRGDYLNDSYKDQNTHGEGKKRKKLKGKGFGDLALKLLSFLPESTRNHLASAQYAKKYFGKDSNSILKKIPGISHIGVALKNIGLGKKKYRKRKSRK